MTDIDKPKSLIDSIFDEATRRPLSANASPRGSNPSSLDRPEWLLREMEKRAPKPNYEPTRIAAYVRYSTDIQTVDSSERQKANIETYCGFAFPNATIEVFQDPERSGKTLERRDDLERMMKGVRAGLIDGIIVEEVDRLSRDLKGGMQLWFEIVENDVELHSVFQRKKLDEGEYGRLLTAASEEANKFKWRAQQARERMAAAGRRPTGAAYGQRQAFTKGRKDVELDKGGTAEIVRLIYDLALEGISTRGIAAWLNEENIPSPRGQRWVDSTVADILRNGRNTGWQRYNQKTQRKDKYGIKKTIPNTSDKWQQYCREELRIVTDEEFERVKEILADRAPRSSSSGSHVKFLLSGKMRCGVCGSTLLLTRGKGGVRFTYCTERTDHGTCDNKEMIAVPRVEEGTLKLVIGALDASKLDEVASAYNEERARRSALSHDRRKQLLDRVAELDALFNRSLDQALTGNIPNDLVVERQRGWMAERDVARAELERLQAERVPVALDLDGVGDLVERLRRLVPGAPFSASDVAGRRMVVSFQALVDKVVVMPRVKGGGVPIVVHTNLAPALAGVPQDPSTRALETVCLPWVRDTRLTADELQEQALAGTYAMAPEELSTALSAVVPSTWRQMDAPPVADVLHFIWFCQRTGTPWERPPAALGAARKLLNAAKRLVFNGSWDAIVDKLRADHPEALKGIDVARVGRMQKLRGEGVKPPVRLDRAPDDATPVADIVDAIGALIAKNGRPMRREDILKHLLAAGIVFPTRVPISGLRTIIWKSHRFKGIHGRGIWLADMPVPLPPTRDADATAAAEKHRADPERRAA